jgi:hypothetical protein
VATVVSTPLSYEEARRFFTEMGCSGFHMCREDPERYAAYKAARIDTATEQAWRLEAVVEIECRICRNEVAPPDLWLQHSRVADVVAQAEDASTVLCSLALTELLRDSVPADSCVLVAESINGRSSEPHGGGLIHFALCTCGALAAQRFCDLARHFARRGQATHPERSQAALARTTEIVRLLSL